MQELYNWPQTPSIEVDTNGVAHVFWYQAFYDDCLSLVGEEVYYKTLEQGVWTDRSATLMGHVGKDTMVAIDRFGRPAFHFAEMVGDTYEAMLAVYVPTANIVGGEDGPFRIIRTTPNPFRDRIAISVASSSGSPAEVGVFDIAGRRISGLLPSSIEPGMTNYSWDGRDAGGSPAPSGIYLVRMSGGPQGGVARIIRIN